MLGIGFFKGQPSEYILKYVSGRVKRTGTGISFFYFPHNTNIVAVPITGIDSGFVFNEVTRNFQPVTLQGQFTYRIQNPEQMATLLNFEIEPKRRSYLSQDLQKLTMRIINIIQVQTRGEIQRRLLEETLNQSEQIAEGVMKRITEGKVLESMGVQLLSIYFQSLKPTPEVAKALEADYREALLRKADQAIYARRAAGVEEEQKIKEKEMSTQIALEEQRKQLIDLQGSNAEEEADFRGKALQKEAEYQTRSLEMQLGVYRNLDPRAILAAALKELGNNAAKVGNLTITSEILASLLNGKAGS